MVAMAASLGLDSQVTALLEGDHLDRAVARVIVRNAHAEVERRNRNLAVMISNVLAGEKPEG